MRGPRARKSPRGWKRQEGGSPNTCRRFCPHPDLGPAPPDWGSAKVCCLKPPVCGPAPGHKHPLQGSLPLPRCGTVCRGPTRPPGPFLLDHGQRECGGCTTAPWIGFHGISTGLRRKTEAEQAGMWPTIPSASFGHTRIACSLESPVGRVTPASHCMSPERSKAWGRGRKGAMPAEPGAPQSWGHDGPMLCLRQVRPERCQTRRPNWDTGVGSLAEPRPRGVPSFTRGHSSGKQQITCESV